MFKDAETLYLMGAFNRGNSVKVPGSFPLSLSILRVMGVDGRVGRKIEVRRERQHWKVTLGEVINRGGEQKK